MRCIHTEIYLYGGWIVIDMEVWDVYDKQIAEQMNKPNKKDCPALHLHLLLFQIDRYSYSGRWVGNWCSYTANISPTPYSSIPYIQLTQTQTQHNTNNRQSHLHLLYYTYTDRPEWQDTTALHASIRYTLHPPGLFDWLILNKPSLHTINRRTNVELSTPSGSVYPSFLLFI